MAVQRPKPQFVVFVSKECRFSHTFITKLSSNQELFAKFNTVDIDNIPDIPDEVTETPCVYDGKQVYLGKQAFDWLNKQLSQLSQPFYPAASKDSMNYAFTDGNEEEVFNGYALLGQKNGSHGMGDPSETKFPAPQQLSDRRNVPPSVQPMGQMGGQMGSQMGQMQQPMDQMGPMGQMGGPMGRMLPMDTQLGMQTPDQPRNLNQQTDMRMAMDPPRMMELNDNSNKNLSLDQIMALREREMSQPI